MTLYSAEVMGKVEAMVVVDSEGCNGSNRMVEKGG